MLPARVGNGPIDVEPDDATGCSAPGSAPRSSSRNSIPGSGCRSPSASRARASCEPSVQTRPSSVYTSLPGVHWTPTVCHRVRSTGSSCWICRLSLPLQWRVANVACRLEPLSSLKSISGGQMSLAGHSRIACEIPTPRSNRNRTRYLPYVCTSPGLLEIPPVAHSPPWFGSLQAEITTIPSVTLTWSGSKKPPGSDSGAPL